MTSETLSCRDVAVRHEHGSPATLEGLSFALRAGERVAVVGLNGAGKTSLLLALVGLAPHEGEIVVCGRRLTRRSAPEVRRSIGFLFNVPEDQLLLPKVVEDVAFGLVQAGHPADEALARARAGLGALGVGHLAEAPLHHLSHGEKQRVALAGAIVAEPSLLLLDEPTAGLDPPGRIALAELLAGLDAAMLIATHDLELVERTCSRILVLEGGGLAAEETDIAAVRSRWGLNGG